MLIALGYLRRPPAITAPSCRPAVNAARRASYLATVAGRARMLPTAQLMHLSSFMLGRPRHLLWRRRADARRVNRRSRAGWFAATLTLSACGSGGVDDVAPPPGTNASGPWRQIFAGYAVTCGVTKAGDTYCWGANDRGQLGDGTQTQRLVPARVSTTERFAAITGDRSTVCGVTDAGDVYCWGFTSNGFALTPRLVQPGLRARDVAVAEVAVCALDVDGVVSCWSTTGVPPAAPTPVSAPLRFRALAGNEGRFCAVALGGDPYCWTTDDQTAVGAVTREPASQALSSIATGGGAPLGGPNTLHACGLAPDGTAYCWGTNDLGQLGDGTTTRRTSAVRTAGGAKFASIGARGGRTCALGLDGLAYCWGFADVIGPGGVNVAPKVIDPALRVASVSVGTRHTCLVTPNGAGYCWGAGGSGQLGHGDTPDYVAAPQRVLDPP